MCNCTSSAKILEIDCESYLMSLLNTNYKVQINIYIYKKKLTGAYWLFVT